ILVFWFTAAVLGSQGSGNKDLQPGLTWTCPSKAARLVNIYGKILRDQLRRSKLCSRESPAETRSLRSRVEQFPSLKGGQQRPHPVVTCSVGSGQNGPPSHCSGG
ncbi:hypothetical protein ATANTOWER_011470, partial [Ataeniobius toweri]|nr:hypothetical protein [Ataeniobius toweri]